MLRAYGTARSGGDRVVVACSGGADSIALAHACADLLGGRRVTLGHVDHRVRSGSDQDAAFVQRFGAEHNLDVRVARLEPGPSDEARLRTERYRVLEALRDERGARWILTAHTENDQAETVLLALVRSGRAMSLRGIPVRRGAILRPMLRVPRAEVRRYAWAHGLAYQDDPTNAEPAYLRNRIRKELLPLLERRYRAGMHRRLARLARQIAGARAKNRVNKIGGEGVERTIALPTFRMERRTWAGGAVPDGRMAALFDADLLHEPIVRRAQAGDRIVPFGMEGHRKLTDVMREAGIPKDARKEAMIVTDAGGEVVWVPGVARSKEAPVGPLTRSVWAFWIVRGEDAQLQGDAAGVTLGVQEDE